jgi:hypothetical protein
MVRKITLTVVPAAILALMVCALDNSASQAFAKGEMGGKGKGIHNMHNHRDFHNRYFGRNYGWGYASYGVEYPVCAPVCQPQVPVVAEAPAPVCTTCAPTCVATYPVYNYGWRYGRDRYRFHRDFRGHEGRGGRGGRK